MLNTPKIKFVIKSLFGGYSFARETNVREDDIYLCSYPKSGNTWVRFMIANLLRPGIAVDFSTIESIVPDWYINDEFALQKIDTPRIIKSHESFRPEYQRVIYIVRDPRDVLVSYYYYMQRKRKIDAAVDLKSFSNMYLSGKLDSYGTWGDNVGSWLGTCRGSDSLLLLRYEDILQDPHHQLQRIAQFIPIVANYDLLHSAVQLSEANSMRRLELRSADKWKGTRNDDKSKPFVRNAAAGGWKNVLDEDSISAIEDRWTKLMRDLNYML
jgi:hypothetical protein